jgi:hypothetical protein
VPPLLLLLLVVVVVFGKLNNHASFRIKKKKSNAIGLASSCTIHPMCPSTAGPHQNEDFVV